MYLETILTHKRAVWRTGSAVTGGLPQNRPRAVEKGRFRRALQGPTVAVIAEVKPMSPSKGQLWPAIHGVELARSYAAHGAAAVSVLADDRFFGGSPALVAQIAQDLGGEIPVLYKDFVVDTRQIELAWRASADAVLVVVRALSDAELTDIVRTADGLGIDVLAEAFTASDVDRALAAGSRIIGVNNRDLDTFAVDLDNSIRLRGLLPDGVVSVSESGITDADGVRRLADAGFDAVLVGETLLGAASVSDTLAQLASVPSARELS